MRILRDGEEGYCLTKTEHLANCDCTLCCIVKVSSVWQGEVGVPSCPQQHVLHHLSWGWWVSICQLLWGSVSLVCVHKNSPADTQMQLQGCISRPEVRSTTHRHPQESGRRFVSALLSYQEPAMMPSWKLDAAALKLSCTWQTRPRDPISFSIFC